MKFMKMVLILTGCVGVASSLCGLTRVRAQDPQDKDEHDTARIQVFAATYGLNCGTNQANNAEDYLKAACDGKRSCSFAIADAAGLIGDHCPGTPKDFNFTYVCGDEEKTGRIQGESVGKTAFLTCARPHVAPTTKEGRALVAKTNK